MEKSLILTRAKSATMAHDFTTATRLYKELLRDDESNVDYLKQLGSIYVQAGEDEKAIPYYTQIITFYPHYVEAMNSLGAIYRRLKRYEESINILQRALDEDRQLPAVNYNLGFTYKEMGNYKDAIDAFEKVIHANPDDVLAYNHLGSIYFAQKDYQKSILSYKRGLQIDQNHPILNYNLARCYEASKNNSEAVRCYKLALKTKPGWTDAIKDFTAFLMKLDDNKGATEIIRQGIKLYPNNSEMLSILGDIYLNEYDYSSAESTFKKAASIDPTNIKSLIGLSKALEKSDKSEYALDAVLSAMEIDPYNQEAKKQYAQTLLSERDYEGAKETIDDLNVPENERDLQVLDLNGQYYICMDDEEKAKTYYDRIKRLNHHYKDYMVNAANRFAQIGNFEKAEVYANEYIVYRPDNIDGYNALGKIAYLKEDFEKASEYYKKAMTLGKNNALAEKQLKTISDRVQREKLFAEKVEEIETEAAIERGEIVSQEVVEQQENDEESFDFAAMGQTVPLQEGLTQKEEDFWKAMDDGKEDEDLPEETAAEEEIEEEEENPIETFAPAPSQLPQVESEEEPAEVEEPEVEPEPEEETVSVEDDLEDQLKNAESDEDFDLFNQEEDLGTEVPLEDSNPIAQEEEEDFDFTDFASASAEEEESVPEPKKVEVPKEPEYEKMSALRDDMQDLQSFAKEAAYNAQKMAMQMADQQQALQQQTEKALEQALERIQDLQQQKMRDQDKKYEDMLMNAPVEEPKEEIVEETAEEIVEEEIPAEEFVEETPEPEEVEESVEEVIIEDFDFPTVENLLEGVEIPEVEETESEEQIEDSVENSVEENIEEPVSEEIVDEETEDEEYIFPTVEDLFGETAEQKSVEVAATLSSVDMLSKIERILNDDDAAMNNAEKIEMFKKLRLLCDYLPESEKDSFQSCRNRMVIDYIISKLSGKPGLLLTAQSLIKSGVLGQEYEANLFKTDDEELNNELIRRVLKMMKAMAQNLEDKSLSQAMCASADNILERIELRNQKSEIF